MKSDLTFRELSNANQIRCEGAFQPVDIWSPNDWMTALAGEVGEAANILKKLRRLADGTNIAKDPQTEEECRQLLKHELADIQIYLDLLATRMNIDLEEAVIDKFNEVSDRMGSKVKL